MTRRHYIDNAPSTTLTGSINNSVTSFGVLSLVGFPSAFPYTVTVDRGTASAEQMMILSVVGTTVTVTRNANGQGAFSHTVGAAYDHTANAVDFDEANAHVNATTNVHGVSGTFVDTTSAQTVAAKTLTGAVVGAVAATGVPGVVVGTSDNTAVSFRVNNQAGTQTAGITGLGAATVTSAAISGAATVGTTLGVSGATTLAGAVAAQAGLTVTGTTTTTALTASGAIQGATVATSGGVNFGGAANVVGLATLAAVSVTGAAAVGGNATVTGTLGVTGTSTFGPILSNQVMKDVADATARAALTPTGHQPIWRTDMKWVEIHDGTAWRVQGVGVVSSVANLALITDPVSGQLAMVAGAIHLHRWNSGTSSWSKVQQTRTEAISFTTQTSFSFPVVFPEAFSAVPDIVCNIATGAGAAAHWLARPINATASGFSIFVYVESGLAASTWASIPVSWIASAN